MIHQRLPDVAQSGPKIFQIVRTQEGLRSGNSVGLARFCRQARVAQFEDGRPTSGNLPQSRASGRTVEHTFQKNVVLDQPCAVDQAICAHIQEGLGASDALSVCRSKQEYRIEAGLFRTLILERCRLPLQMTEKVCECGTMLDSTGRHRAACNRSGRLKKRALAPEEARVCREAGATVRCNAKLCDMNLAVAANDDRAISRFRTSVVLRSSVGCRHHSPLRPCCGRDGTARGGQG